MIVHVATFLSSMGGSLDKDHYQSYFALEICAKCSTLIIDDTEVYPGHGEGFRVEKWEMQVK